VRKGVPFRQTHHVAGAAVRAAEVARKPMSSLTLGELQALHPLFEADVADVWSFDNSVEKRNSIGGTSKDSVLRQVKQLREWLA